MHAPSCTYVLTWFYETQPHCAAITGARHEKAKEAKRRLQQTVADAAAGASLSTAGSLAAPSAAELNTAAAAIEQDLNAVLFERRLDDQGEERARARAANPLVNLAADQDDSLGQGFGTAHDARRVSPVQRGGRVAGGGESQG